MVKITITWLPEFQMLFVSIHCKNEIVKKNNLIVIYFGFKSCLYIIQPQLLLNDATLYQSAYLLLIQLQYTYTLQLYSPLLVRFCYSCILQDTTIVYILCTAVVSCNTIQTVLRNNFYTISLFVSFFFIGNHTIYRNSYIATAYPYREKPQLCCLSLFEHTLSLLLTC